MLAQRVLGHSAYVWPAVAADGLTRQALGLALLVLVLSSGYALSRGEALDPAEAAVEVVAAEEEEPIPATPRESPYSLSQVNAHINEVAARHGVEPRLVAAIVAVESRFDARAVSRRGAEGLMQLMPQTAAELDVEDSFNPRDNLDGGVRHLKRLMGRFHNDLPLVLAAYNAGEQAVINHRGIPPFRETRQYVVRVLRRYDRDAARAVAQQLAAPRAVPARPGPRVSYAAPSAMPVRLTPVSLTVEHVGVAAVTTPYVTTPYVTTPYVGTPHVGIPPEQKKQAESP
jgi:hypothetical protein